MVTATAVNKEFRARLGRCYILAGRYMFKHPKAILVHGTIQGGRWGKDTQVEHAWVEEGGEVKEFVLDWQLPTDAYYAIFEATARRKYTQDEVMEMVARRKHWGPWDMEKEGN